MKNILVLLVVLACLLLSGCMAEQQPAPESAGEQEPLSAVKTEIQPFSQEIGGKTLWGYEDGSRNVVIEAQYDVAEPFSEGMAVVGMKDPDSNESGHDQVAYEFDYKYTYIDEKGRTVSDFIWEVAYPFSAEGVAVVGVGESYFGDLFHFEGEYGVIDKTGSYLIPPTYKDVGSTSFSEGMLPVLIGSLGYGEEEERGKYGYVDIHGNLVIQPQWDYAAGFVDGIAQVYLAGEGGERDFDAYWYLEYPYQGEYSIIDVTGKTLLHITSDMLGEGTFHGILLEVKGKNRIHLTKQMDDFSVYLDIHGNKIE